LFERASDCITGVREGGGVVLKGGEGHKEFSTNFKVKEFVDCFGDKGLNIGGDVLPDFAIASCGSLNELAPFIDDGTSHSVNFGHNDKATFELGSPLIEGGFIIALIEGEHGLFMGDFSAKFIEATKFIEEWVCGVEGS
jgi:hypothetical protein